MIWMQIVSLGGDPGSKMKEQRNKTGKKGKQVNKCVLMRSFTL